MCCLFCASLSPFVRCEEAEGGVSRSLLYVGNNGSLSLQWVNGKKPEVQVTSVYGRRVKYGTVKTFVEEPANSFSTLKMEAEGISEMLVLFTAPRPQNTAVTIFITVETSDFTRRRQGF
jgi:hypothetical protein